MLPDKANKKITIFEQIREKEGPPDNFSLKIKNV